jgi:uncharacterized protein
MDIKLKKRPKNPIIIEGFPGFGLVGSIATEFLIEHCKCEQIGAHWFEELPATIAVHQGKIINPLNIHYNEPNNLVIVHAISAGPGTEWMISDYVLKLAHELEAKEIVSLEGVGSPKPQETSKVFFVTSEAEKEGDLKKLGTEQLQEGILVGVTSALLLKSSLPITAFFAETHSELPDSNASAQIIEVLNKYLNLDIDTQPLVEQAKKFEEKLNSLLKQSASTQSQVKKKAMSYVG